MTWMAPIMLVQVGVMQPDGPSRFSTPGRRATPVTRTGARHSLSLTLPLRNPITIGTVAGGPAVTLPARARCRRC